jgi:hypothetical protein
MTLNLSDFVLKVQTMNISFLGVKRRIENILPKIERANINITPYIYNDVKDIPGILKDIKDTEGFLFTGKYPYSIAKDYIRADIPSVYLIFDESCFLTTLLKTKKHPYKISADTIDKNIITKVYKELNLNLQKIDHISFDFNTNIADIANYHQKKYLSDNETTIFTCLYTVYDELLKRNIPAILVNHTHFSINRGIENLLTKFYFHNSKNSYPAVIILKISNYNEILGKVLNEFKLQKMLLKLYEQLLFFQEELSAFLMNRTEDTYTFITTRYFVERYTDNYKNFPLKMEIFNKFGIKFKISVGYSANPQTAYYNSKSSMALLEKEHEIIVRTEDGKIIYIRDEIYSELSMQTTDGYLKNISEKTGIGLINLTKIQNMIKMHNKKEFSAFDIARELNISLRTGNRIINGLKKSNLAVETGLEQPPKGRPRKIYKILLKG